MFKNPFNNQYFKVITVITIAITLIFVVLPLTAELLKVFYSEYTTIEHKTAKDAIVAFDVIVTSLIFTMTSFISYDIINNE